MEGQNNEGLIEENNEQNAWRYLEISINCDGYRIPAQVPIIGGLSTKW